MQQSIASNDCMEVSQPGNLRCGHLSCAPLSFEIARYCLPPHPHRKVVNAQLRAAQRKSPLLGRPGFLIRRLHQLHCALFLEETRRFGITPVQYSLLTTLAACGEMDQNGLALEIGLERTSVAEVIPRLQARGFLDRRRSIDDGRVKLVKLTRKGSTLIRKMAPAVRRAHDRTVDQLDPKDRKQFLLQLIKLVESNNQIAVVPLRLR
jgi:MarR family transcriptional regulator, lower aerobic nicotinate degradation pathway regulator